MPGVPAMVWNTLTKFFNLKNLKKCFSTPGLNASILGLDVLCTVLYLSLCGYRCPFEDSNKFYFFVYITTLFVE